MQTVTFGPLSAEADVPGWYSPGEMQYDFVDSTTNEQRAILDLAWPQGIQFELSDPVCVLIDESAELISMASAAGFRCFTEVAEFRAYVQSLAEPMVAAE